MKTNLGLIGLAVIAVIAWMSAYTVDQRERVILFNLGKIKQVDMKPGLHFKLPFVNNVRRFDGRILTLDAQPEPFLTSEKKNVIVDFFVKWKIDDVAHFYRSTRGQEVVAQNRLLQIIKDGLRNEFAKRTINEAVSGERNDIMAAINTSSNTLAKDLGIVVVDVRISRIDFSEEISDSVYDRMRAERARIAEEFRAAGREESERLRAGADKERTVIVANSFRDAQVLRGEGDAKSTEIYANTYTQDPEFYSFYRSLESYRKSFSSGSDIMMLDPDGEFFRYFNESKSGK